MIEAVPDRADTLKAEKKLTENVLKAKDMDKVINFPNMKPE